MEEKNTGSAGQQFVKKIRPIGCALFLIVGILTVIICFTSKGIPVEGYKAPNTSKYYSEHLDELKEELETNLFPRINGVLSCSISGDKLRIEFTEDDIAVSRSNILYYYDSGLFEFVKAGSAEE